MTQTDRVLKHLQTWGSITQREADDEYGITRLGARIYDLRRRGHKIVSIVEHGQNKFGDPVHYARYRML